GTRVPCVSCIGPDGLGRLDAGVVPSDICWANLTKPYGLRHDNGRAHPAYTADAIMRAVTTGVDPAGNSLDQAMPRYTLDGTATRDLVAYLKRLGSDSDQGAGSKEIVIGAVVPSGGPFAGIGSVVTRLLSAYFDRVNQEGGIYNRQVVLKTAAFDSSGSAVDALARSKRPPKHALRRTAETSWRSVPQTGHTEGEQNRGTDLMPDHIHMM